MAHNNDDDNRNGDDDDVAGELAPDTHFENRGDFDSVGAFENLSDPYKAFRNPDSFKAPETQTTRPRISLGPLSLLGFGPPPAPPEPGSPEATQRSTLVQVASFAIVVAALKIASPVLVPLTISAFLAVLTAPIVFYLQKRRVPPELGVPVVVLLVIAMMGGIAALVASSATSLIEQLPFYDERARHMLGQSLNTLEHFGLRVSTHSVRDLVKPDAAMQFAADVLSTVADMLSEIVLVILTTIFILFEALVLPAKIRDALGDPDADLSKGIHVIGRIKAYVVIKTWISLATGVIISGTLYLMGVDFALLWGLLAFFFNFIPNIGSILAAVPAIILAFLQLGPTAALGTLVVFVVVNMVIGNIVEPKIMGQKMNLSPLVVFISLLFWGWLWGGVGMLLSVPLTMAMRIMLEGNPSTRPFAVLMAEREDPAASLKSKEAGSV